MKSLALLHQLRRALASLEAEDGFSLPLSGMEHFLNGANPKMLNAQAGVVR